MKKNTGLFLLVVGLALTIAILLNIAAEKADSLLLAKRYFSIALVISAVVPFVYNAAFAHDCVSENKVYVFGAFFTMAILMLLAWVITWVGAATFSSEIHMMNHPYITISICFGVAQLISFLFILKYKSRRYAG